MSIRNAGAGGARRCLLSLLRCPGAHSRLILWWSCRRGHRDDRWRAILRGRLDRIPGAGSGLSARVPLRTGDRPCWPCWWRMIQPPTGAHLSSPLRPPREATPVSNLQSLCLAPPRAEPSSCAYGCLRREEYTHVLIARRAARPAQQIETSPCQMGIGSQFLSLTAGFGEGSGKRPKNSEKQEARL